MVICRKEAKSNGVREETAERRERTAATRQGGPVFLPPRRPSAFATSLLADDPLAAGRVTAYDEIWYTGRPRS